MKNIEKLELLEDKQPLKGGDEYDILTTARHIYCYTDNPGVCKSAKQRYNRRLRRKARRLARQIENNHS